MNYSVKDHLSKCQPHDTALAAELKVAAAWEAGTWSLQTCYDVKRWRVEAKELSRQISKRGIKVAASSICHRKLHKFCYDVRKAADPKVTPVRTMK
jgi:hypothetical protein